MTSYLELKKLMEWDAEVLPEGSFVKVESIPELSFCSWYRRFSFKAKIFGYVQVGQNIVYKIQTKRRPINIPKHCLSNVKRTRKGKIKSCVFPIDDRYFKN